MTRVFVALALTTGVSWSGQAAQPTAVSDTTLPSGAIAPVLIQSSRRIQYPPIAVRCNLEGDATLELVISEQGEVSDAKIAKTTGYSALDAAAVSSAKQWRYKPATSNGSAIASRIMAVVQFRSDSSVQPCRYLPPSAYSSGLPPGFSPVELPDSALVEPGEKLLSQDAIRMAPGTISQGRVLHVPREGETLRIDYSINPPSARMRVLVVTDEQQRDETRGKTPTGTYPLDQMASGRGSRSLSLQVGDYWVLWLFADAPSDTIISYNEVVAARSQGGAP